MDRDIAAAIASLERLRDSGKVSFQELEKSALALETAIRDRAGSAPPVLAALIEDLHTRGGASLEGLNASFEAFGLKTKGVLQLLADTALMDFADILKGGEATPQQLLTTWQRILKEITAAGFATLPPDFQAIANQMQGIATKLGVTLPQPFHDAFNQIDVDGKKSLGALQVSLAGLDASLLQTRGALEATTDGWKILDTSVLETRGALEATQGVVGGLNTSLLDSRGALERLGTQGKQTSEELAQAMRDAAIAATEWGSIARRNLELLDLTSAATAKLNNLQIQSDQKFASDIPGLQQQLQQQNALLNQTGYNRSPADATNRTAAQQAIALITQKLAALGVDAQGHAQATGTGSGTGGTGSSSLSKATASQGASSKSLGVSGGGGNAPVIRPTLSGAVIQGSTVVLEGTPYAQVATSPSGGVIFQVASGQPVPSGAKVYDRASGYYYLGDVGSSGATLSNGQTILFPEQGATSSLVTGGGQHTADTKADLGVAADQVAGAKQLLAIFNATGNQEIRKYLNALQEGFADNASQIAYNTKILQESGTAFASWHNAAGQSVGELRRNGEAIVDYTLVQQRATQAVQDFASSASGASSSLGSGSQTRWSASGADALRGYDVALAEGLPDSAAQVAEVKRLLQQTGTSISMLTDMTGDMVTITDAQHNILLQYKDLMQSTSGGSGSLVTGGFSTLRTQRFAQGGVVQGSGGTDSELIRATPGERVQTPAQARASDRGGAPSITVHVNVNVPQTSLSRLDAQTIVTQLTPALQEALRRQILPSLGLLP